MKIIGKVIFPLLLIATMLTSCGSFMSRTGTNPTVAMETAMPFVWTEAAKTQTLTPTVTPTPLPFLEGTFTPIPGPGSYLSPVPPNPDQQIYIDPEGWYSIYFPKKAF